MEIEHNLHQSFLRGLEADLRGLCADARRRSPDVKEAAEQVILSLKEADGPSALSDAADQAASVFCTACEAPDTKSSSTTQTAQTKIALRAVSSLHKLLTHRALYQSRLSDVLNALERLSASSADDNITLKVLQGLLSLLTVRSYIVSLTEEELSRAFSLLFALRSSRHNAGGNSATGALSAISNISATEIGVIEQTAKAAFCQVSSDLFSCAADAAVKTAVQREAPSGEFIPLALFPNEVRAAFGLFMDLCNICSGEQLEWLSQFQHRADSTYDGLKPEIALEVLDDGLASNIALFAGQPVFMEALTSRLCPVILKLLQTAKEKHLCKAMFSLLVTIVRDYWRNLIPDAEILLRTIAEMSDIHSIKDGSSLPWSVTFSLEAIRCILKRTDTDGSQLVDLIKELDMKKVSGQHMAMVIRAISAVVSHTNDRITNPIPSPPVVGTMKPFGNIISNSEELAAALALGSIVEVVSAAWDSYNDGNLEIAKYMTAQMSPSSIIALGTVIERSILQEDNSGASQISTAPSARETLSSTISHVAIICDASELSDSREAALKALSSASLSSARAVDAHSVPSQAIGRMSMFYKFLFDAVVGCSAALGRSWIPILRALEQLDVLAHTDSLTRGHDDESSKEIFDLEEQMKNLLMSTAVQGWDVCHDMVSALVQSSRQSIGYASGADKSAEDMRRAQQAHASRFFAVEYAERSLIKALEKRMVAENSEPMSLWQLLSGHLVSVCTDSSSAALREAGLASLTRLACDAIACQGGDIISHDKIIMPFLDLLTATFSDIRSGALNSVHTILTTQGELLSGEDSWCAIISILSSAGRWTGSFAELTDEKSKTGSQLDSSALTPNQQAIDMASEGFRVVQVLANDFLGSLSTKSLRDWIDLLEVYCRQENDVNVALTSLGLLWRTADYLAKSPTQVPRTDMWISLFRLLKDVSMDERPEIRKCAIKTLTEALSSHGQSFSATAWRECVEQSLLPLLENVMSAGTSNKSNDETAVRKRTDEVPLLLHHSRDTPRKQWNETRVLALAGVTKIITTALPNLSPMGSEKSSPLSYSLVDGSGHTLWRKMLRAASVASNSRDSEVAVAGVSSLLDFLTAAGHIMVNGAASPAVSSEIEHMVEQPNDSGLEAMPSYSENRSEARGGNGIRSLWEAIWYAICEAITGSFSSTGGSAMVDVASSELRIVDRKALTMLAEGLIRTRKEFSTALTPASSEALVHSLLVLATKTPQDQDIQELSTSLGPVQIAALEDMETLSFGLDFGSWEYFLADVMRTLQTYSESTTSENPSLIEHLIKVLAGVYKRLETPNEVRFSKLKELLQVMWRIFLFSAQRIADETKIGIVSTQTSLSKTSQNAKSPSPYPYMSALDCIFTAMKGAAESDSKAMGEDIWSAFLDIVETFLFKSDRIIWQTIPTSSGKLRSKRELYNAKVIDCIELGLVSNEGASSVQSRLLDILSRGSEEGEGQKRPKFVRTCQEKLFRLACISESNPKWSQNTAETSQRHVVNTCNRVLGQFVADDQRAGRCPLPARRRGEVVFLLTQLIRLHKMGNHDGSQSFLSLLYPRLYECVESRDEVVRLLARELLEEAKPTPRLNGSTQSATSITEKRAH